MSETRALALRSITPDVWNVVREIAPAMHQSRLFGVSSAEQAVAVMLKGHELGLPLTASFEFIHIIQGKPSLAPRGALALIHQHSDLVDVKVKQSDDKTCTVWMRRKETGFEFERTFTIQDAEKAQLVKPDSGWNKYPANMLLWRCVGFVADVVCPDLIGGLKRADELGADIDREGNVIEGSWSSTTATPTVAPVAPSPPQISLDDLLARYSPDQIMEANNGQIPGTTEEVAIVAERLAAANG